jgi:hypothetical protein
MLKRPRGTGRPARRRSEALAPRKNAFSTLMFGRTAGRGVPGLLCAPIALTCLVTSGVSAGIDMALHLVRRLAGEERARAVRRGIQYDPAPPVWPEEDPNRPLAT